MEHWCTPVCRRRTSVQRVQHSRWCRTAQRCTTETATGRGQSPEERRRAARRLPTAACCSRPAGCDRAGTTAATLVPCRRCRTTAAADERGCRDRRSEKATLRSKRPSSVTSWRRCRTGRAKARSLSSDSAGMPTAVAVADPAHGVGRISHRCRDITSFPLNFLLPVHSTSDLKMFPLRQIDETLHARV